MSERQWYKLIFEQVQPIHMGSGSYGVINETRVFIPGWTMWGALTKAYGINNKWNKKDWENEKNQNLFENISCFYPAFKNKDNFEILFPQFKNGEFYLGDYSEDEFRAKFVDTFMSTAIHPLTNTALDESLHELNVILTSAKADFIEFEKEKQLYWVGIVEINDGGKIPDEIYIGGDVKYGLGKMVLLKKEKLDNEGKNKWFIQNEIIINYLPAKKNLEKTEGKVELLVDIEKSWEKADLSVNLKNGKGFFFVPGSKVLNGETFQSIKKGILT